MTILLPTLVVLLLDQATKALAYGAVLREPWIEPAPNHDLALGLVGAPAPVELLAGVIGIGLAWRIVQRASTSTAAMVAFGLVVGGCAGNLLDRALAGAVRDFLVGPGILFNVADIALLAGLLGLLLARMPLGRPWSPRAERAMGG